MNYRKLGSTQLMVSEIGFGGIPIQRTTQEDVNKIIEKLYENKINFIDTARGYTTSEEMLGVALKKKRNDFYLATKSMQRSYEGMKKDIEISLKNLQTEWIDLYQLHNLKTKEEYELVMSDQGAYKALLEAKQDGKIRHIGITSHSCDFLMSIIDTMVFETIQFPYNLVERQASELFEIAKKKDIGVIVMKPLAGGAIDNSTIALKFILQNSNISTAIPGMGSCKEVEENSQISELSQNFTEEEQTLADAFYKELGNDFCRRCGYCLPCSVGIDIPSCFLMEGYYNRYHLEDWAKERYGTFKKTASDCIACGKCMSKCPYHLNIIEKLKKVSKIFGK